MSDEVQEYNPPEGWQPPEVPTAENEVEILEAEFGPMDEDGIFAPHVEGGGE